VASNRQDAPPNNKCFILMLFIFALIF